ncbi:MAG: hypothetical protein GX148_06545 [Clostridiales bacterium]|jgi:cation transport ATPase|nr:hypothetical protein [Clostridiales bacterium]
MVEEKTAEKTKLPSKAQFDAVFEKEEANYKISLLEKHLMESREEYNRLKDEELALRAKQTELISQMEENFEKTKKVDEILAQSISEKIESIKTEMFTEWQESVKESLVASVAELTEQKLKEYREIYEKQNQVIENQAKKFRNVIVSTRMMRFMCYAICFVATLVLLFIPIAQYLAKEVMALLEEFSWWGLFVLVMAVILLIIALALAILLRRRTPKE